MSTSTLQVLKRLKAKSEIRVLDDIVRLAPQLLAQIMKMTYVDIPSNSAVTARVIASTGLGVSGGLCLGWADTKGFHMVGMRGSVSAAAQLGGDIMAGLHHTRKYVKAILGISNLCVEMVFELPEKAKTGVAGKPSEELKLPEDLPAEEVLNMSMAEAIAAAAPPPSDPVAGEAAQLSDSTASGSGGTGGTHESAKDPNATSASTL